MTRPARYFLPIYLALAALVALAAAPAKADTRRFGLTSFDRVQVYGDMIVVVTVGQRIGAVAEGTRAALETLSMQVNGRTLVIRQVSEGAFGPRRGIDGPVTIRLSAQNLEQALLRGSGQMRITGLRGPDVRLDLDGPGSMSATIPAGESVRARAVGSGQMQLTGAARSLLAITNGAATLDASGLSARDVTIQSTGAGASRFAASLSADVVATGSSNVTVTGRARCTVRNLGAGTVLCGLEAGQPLVR